MTSVSGNAWRFRDRPDAGGSSRPVRAATNPHFGSGTNWAVTCSSGPGRIAGGLTWQVSAPEQAPLQPAKLEPDPPPAIATVRLHGGIGTGPGAGGAKLASIVTGEPMVTVQVGPPVQPGYAGVGGDDQIVHQPSNQAPSVAVAVSVTTVPAGNVPSQGPPVLGKSQFTPAGELTIVPDPP